MNSCINTHMKLFEILLETFSLAKKEFYQEKVFPDSVIDNYLRLFKRLNMQNKIQGPETDINFWRNRGFGELRDFVNAKLYTPSKTQLKRKVARDDQVNILDDNNWSVDVSRDATAACNLGKNTGWCTSIVDSDYFDRLKKRGSTLIHIRSKHNNDQRNQYAIVFTPPSDIEIVDGTDEYVSSQEFESKTKLKINDLISML